MAQERTYISFDWALKKLLRQKANFGILEGFLSDKNYQAKGLKEVEEKMRIEGLSPEEKTAYEQHQLNLISERNIVNTARMEGENTGIQLTLQIIRLFKEGKTIEAITKTVEKPTELVKKVLKEAGFEVLLAC